MTVDLRAGIATGLATAFCVALGIVGAAVASSASAQDALIDRGRSVAQTWCVSCHAIGEGTQESALVGAPSFRSLGRRGDLDSDALAAALLRPHPVMPEMPLSKRDLRGLAAFLRWIAEEDRADLRRVSPSVEMGSQTGSASDAGRIEKGRTIVSDRCAQCHATSGAGPSPVADAPPFSTLSRNYPVAHLAEALAEGILVGHPEVDMPEFVFSPNEVGAIIAYLESVQAQ